MVVISQSCTSNGRVRHASMGTPSIRTVQAPHSPNSQPCFVPVRPKSSRNTSSKVWWGTTAIAPLTIDMQRNQLAHARLLRVRFIEPSIQSNSLQLIVHYVERFVLS